VDLRVARVAERGALLVRAPDGGDVAALRVGREVEDVAVAARRQDDRVSRVRLEQAVRQVAGDDAARLAVHQHQLQHLVARVHRDLAQADLPLQRLVGAEQELLARLAARVERARDLGAAERAVGEDAAVLARERHALRDALVDDVHRLLGQAVDVRLARAEVAALHRVVEEAVHAVAVVLVVLRRVDPALGRDRVRAARAVLVAEAEHLVAQLGHGRGGGRPRRGPTRPRSPGASACWRGSPASSRTCASPSASRSAPSEHSPEDPCVTYSVESGEGRERRIHSGARSGGARGGAAQRPSLDRGSMVT
jgi:hypothetical protein